MEIIKYFPAKRVAQAAAQPCKLQICSSPVLKSRDREPESYSSVHAKKPSIYSDDFLSHGMSVLSQYFHLVSTKCKMCNGWGLPVLLLALR